MLRVWTTTPTPLAPAQCDVTNEAAVISTFGIGGVPTIKLWWQGRGPASYTGGRTLEELEEMVRLSQGPSLKTATAVELADMAGTLTGTKTAQFLGSYVIAVPPGLSANRLANIEMVAHNRRNRAVFVKLIGLAGNDVVVYGRDLKQLAPAVTITIADNLLSGDPTGTATHIAAVSTAVDENTYALISDMSTTAYARLLERDVAICWAFFDTENPSGNAVAVTAATKTAIKTAIEAVAANKGKVAVIHADGRFWHHKALEMITGLSGETDPRSFLPAMACEYDANYVMVPLVSSNQVIPGAALTTLFNDARGLVPP